ncbi:MAG: glycosyltransferase family 4 protein [Acidobacteriota bacterium]
MRKWEPQLRILYFAPRLCVPTNTGAHLRNFHLTRELSQSARVVFLSFPNQDSETAVDTDETKEWGVQRVVTVPRAGGYSAGKILRGAVGKTPLPILNYTTDDMHETLARLLDEEDFHIVQIESVQLSAYLPTIRRARSKPSIICDWHNVESELMQRYSEHATNPARKMYARMTARRLEAVERRVLRDCDAHFTVSQRDRLRLLEMNPKAQISVADNGVDARHYSPQACQKAYEHWLNSLSDNSLKNRSAINGRPRLLFVGSMDYHANIDAALYFANEIWSEVYQKHPEMIFTIVGRNPAKVVQELANLPGIEVTGTVDDVRPFYAEAFASVVPLRVGGGSRLKILESMAAGVPVISTRLGAEGIAVCDGENILLADSQASLAQHISQVLINRELQNKLSQAAQTLVHKGYDWSAIGSVLLNAYAKLSQANRWSFESTGVTLTS